jgi:hypothetical protein
MSLERTLIDFLRYIRDFLHIPQNTERVYCTTPLLLAERTGGMGRRTQTDYTAVEAAAVEARRRVRLNEGRER